MLPSILFVCTGNICRSPLAEISMRIEASKRGLTCDIDSAATGRWNLHERPDFRAQNIIQKYHPSQILAMEQLSSRQVTKEDFLRFTHMIALDQTHFDWLKKEKPQNANPHISLLMEYLPQTTDKNVPDPYFGSENDFEYSWSLIKEACSELAIALFDR
ncbi:low molecular weight phosphotyrosine protein phosphatase [Acetobacteraceae bacterium]|nr:low molecular weight phosphotyrosine protein phosphatase [Acetobacteraceae bacterium]